MSAKKARLRRLAEPGNAKAQFSIFESAALRVIRG
jgi:hypothetical protein